MQNLGERKLSFLNCSSKLCIWNSGRKKGGEKSGGQSPATDKQPYLIKHWVTVNDFSHHEAKQEKHIYAEILTEKIKEVKVIDYNEGPENLLMSG